MTKQKGLRVAIILTMIVLTISAFSLLISNIVLLNTSNKSQKKESNAADVTISNYAELKAFADNVTAGTTYEGQTVQLTDSINCAYKDLIIGQTTVISEDYAGGQTILSPQYHPFKGIFDGKGFSISNFCSRTSTYSDGVGLFERNEGTIKNLRLYNAEIRANETYPYYKQYCGTIAGYNSGIIECCIQKKTWINVKWQVFVGEIVEK